MSVTLGESLPEIVTASVPGPNGKALMERRAKAVVGAVQCGYPCTIRRGEGAMFEDVDGNRFLDWIGGVGVLNVGYSQPEIVEAVRAQAAKFFHGMQHIVTHEGYVALAEKLNEVMPTRGGSRKTLFANSGAEADENAVKIAKSATGRPNIIVFSGAFHGRTAMTLTMTSKKAYSYGLGPFPDGVYRAEFPYLYRAPAGMTEEEAIRYYVGRFKSVFEEASPAEYVAAVVVEPVQGEGGFVPAPIEWVRAVREICDRHGILLVADEVQSGFGRSGRMFVSDYWKEAGCAPDLISFAKSVAAGVPLSGVTGDAKVMDRVRPGVVGGTFGGNALACAAALKVIEIMRRDDLPGRALAIGRRVTDAYRSWQKKYPVVGDVRGVGAMVGIEFVKDRESKEPYPELVKKIIADSVQHGLLLENAGTCGNVIRFLCPLVVTDAQLDAGLRIMENALKASLS